MKSHSPSEYNEQRNIIISILVVIIIIIITGYTAYNYSVSNLDFTANAITSDNRNIEVYIRIEGLQKKDQFTSELIGQFVVQEITKAYKTNELFTSRHQYKNDIVLTITEQLKEINKNVESVTILDLSIKLNEDE